MTNQKMIIDRPKKCDCCGGNMWEGKCIECGTSEYGNCPECGERLNPEEDIYHFHNPQDGFGYGEDVNEVLVCVSDVCDYFIEY